MRSLRAIAALVRAAWLTAASYKLGFLFSLGSLVVTAVPMWLGANALQGTMAHVIEGEARSYAGFLFVGIAATLWIALACTQLAEELEGAVQSGRFEALTATRAPLPAILAGLSGYRVLFTAARSFVLLGSSALLGVAFSLRGLPLGLLTLVLLTLAYLPVGVLAAASMLAFRQHGVLPAATLAASSVLGGIYVPASALPDWLRWASAALPATYGVRALRRTLLEGAGLAQVGGDLAVLLLFIVLAGIPAVVLFAMALRRSRRTGTLAQY